MGEPGDKLAGGFPLPAGAWRVAVVIPYYQVKPGLLQQALLSVQGQELPDGVGWHVIVVDDGSPLPARDEIAGLAPELQRAITLIEQENGGPGSARNRALDWIAARRALDPTAFEVVAFLDSDDTWARRHLADALDLIGRGHDLYFCNHRRFEDSLSYFEQVPALASLFAHATEGVSVIMEDGPVVGLSAEALMTVQLCAYASQTSTVVVRAECVATERFDTEMRHAGEDHLFWVAIAAARPRTAVSWRSNVHCGRGINVYFASLDWGSVKVVERVGDVLMFHHKARQTFDLSTGHSNILRKRIVHYERGYSFLFVRALLRGQLPPLEQFWRLVSQSHALVPLMPLRFVRMLIDRRPESRFW
jgi:succinoglycan biosynthesis protein ExoW